MLVLTRKPEEDIVISTEEDEIVVKILKVHSNKVSIGIKADKKWQIVRMELLDEKSNKKGKQNDSNSNQDDDETEQPAAIKEEDLVLVGASNN
ncbi:MAG: carbon storage regulator [Chlamydiota bacterium]|nr:carbon storage regulator [Chlamydiota bacterium]